MMGKHNVFMQLKHNHTYVHVHKRFFYTHEPGTCRYKIFYSELITLNFNKKYTVTNIEIILRRG